MDFCAFCGENDSAIRCTKCNFSYCLNCISGGLCEECRPDLCGICNNIYCDCKYCDKCKRICCIECIAITGCQTIIGTCKECFDYKCEVCHKKNLTGSYLWDHHEHQPICSKCKNDSYIRILKI